MAKRAHPTGASSCCHGPSSSCSLSFFSCGPLPWPLLPTSARFPSRALWEPRGAASARLQSTRARLQSTRARLQSTRARFQSTRARFQSMRARFQSTRARFQPTGARFQSTGAPTGVRCHHPKPPARATRGATRGHLQCCWLMPFPLQCRGLMLLDILGMRSCGLSSWTCVTLMALGCALGARVCANMATAHWGGSL